MDVIEFTLGELAELTNTEVKGDSHLIIQNVATLERAKQGEISFVSNPKYKSYLSNSKASAVVLSDDVAKDFSGNALVAKDPYLTFAKVVSCFYPHKESKGNKHPSAVIDKTAKIAESVDIGPNVVIEENAVIHAGSKIEAGSFVGKNTTIGSGSVIHPNVSIYSDTVIGKNAIIHSGAVIGADGFGFALQADKEWYKIKQVGNVIIGDDVEIGANTTVDRAALGSTILSNGVKLDNQLQIGHNVQIGEHTIMAGGTVVAGSSKIGKRCQVGGAAAISGHLEITDDVVVTGRGMVIGSINKPGVYSSGITTDTNKNWRRNAARFRQLDIMAKKLRQLEKELDAIKKD